LGKNILIKVLKFRRTFDGTAQKYGKQLFWDEELIQEHAINLCPIV